MSSNFRSQSYHGIMQTLKVLEKEHYSFHMGIKLLNNEDGRLIGTEVTVFTKFTYEDGKLMLVILILNQISIRMKIAIKVMLGAYLALHSTTERL